MSKELIPLQENDEEGNDLLKKEPSELKDSFLPEEIIIVTPTKPMTTSEVLEEMKKQGMRPATFDEMENMLEKVTGIIEPKDTDIVIESEKPKELPK